MNCGITDMRVLEINHLNGDRKKDIQKYGTNLALYQATINGTKPINDLDVRCANCNHLYAYECGVGGMR